MTDRLYFRQLLSGRDFAIGDEAATQMVNFAYLIGDRESGEVLLVDPAYRVADLVAVAEGDGMRVVGALGTHHHADHVGGKFMGYAVEGIRELLDRLSVPIHVNRAEAEFVRKTTDVAASDLIGHDGGDRISVGGIEIELLHTPGHTAGMLSLLVNRTDVFTGDTLFKNSVGGVRAPGHTTYSDLKTSIMDKLLTLPEATRIHPGHTDPTTVADELAHNPFVRIWRGEDPEGQETCTAFGKPATLILLATDYDGGHKAWVRWPDGSDDIVPGSQVQRGNGAAEEPTGGGIQN